MSNSWLDRIYLIFFPDLFLEGDFLPLTGDLLFAYLYYFYYAYFFI